MGDSALWVSGLHPTCLVPLVAAAPFIPAEDARVVGAQQAGVVDADLPQRRQPLVQLVHTLQGMRGRGHDERSPPPGRPPSLKLPCLSGLHSLEIWLSSFGGIRKSCPFSRRRQPTPSTWPGEESEGWISAPTPFSTQHLMWYTDCTLNVVALKAGV